MDFEAYGKLFICMCKEKKIGGGWWC